LTDRPDHRGMLNQLAAGPTALVLTFVVIAVLAAVDAFLPRVTAPGAVPPRPLASRVPLTRLTATPTTVLSGTHPGMTFLAGITPGTENRLWGMMATGRNLTLSSWIVPVRAQRRTAARITTLREGRAQSYALTTVSHNIVLLALRDGRPDSTIDAFALTGEARLVASSRIAIAAPPPGTTRTLVAGLWHGAASLIVIDEYPDHTDRLVILRGPLGQGPRIFDKRITRAHASCDLTAISLPVVLDSAPDLLCVTRLRTASGTTEVHEVPGDTGFARPGFQLPTNLPDSQPQLRYAVGLRDRELVALYAIDPRTGVTRTIPLPIATPGSPAG
jgi:hypothetical protein